MRGEYARHTSACYTRLAEILRKLEALVLRKRKQKTGLAEKVSVCTKRASISSRVAPRQVATPWVPEGTHEFPGACRPPVPGTKASERRTTTYPAQFLVFVEKIR